MSAPLLDGRTGGSTIQTLSASATLRCHIRGRAAAAAAAAPEMDDSKLDNHRILSVVPAP